MKGRGLWSKETFTKFHRGMVKSHHGVISCRLLIKFWQYCSIIINSIKHFRDHSPNFSWNVSLLHIVGNQAICWFVEGIEIAVFTLRDHVFIHSLQDSKLSLTSAYAKLGHSRTIFLCVQDHWALSSNVSPLCSNPCRAIFLHYAVVIHSLCEYYDIYGWRRQFVERTFVETCQYGDSWKVTFSKEEEQDYDFFGS